MQHNKSVSERVAEGLHANNLLEDPVLNDVLDRIENNWLQAIVNSTPSDGDKRELAYTMLYGAKRLRTELKALIQDAQLLISRREDNDGN